MAKSSRWEKIAEIHPDRVRSVAGYAQNREWAKAYRRHGRALGLTRQEFRGFAKWAKHLHAGERGSQLEITSEDDSMSVSSKGARVKTLEDLIATAEIDIEREWRVEKWSSNVWEVASRGDHGMEVTPVWQVKAHLERRRWSEAAKIQPMRVFEREKPDPITDGLHRILFIPDTQHGFRWSPGFKYLDPLHDRRAVDLAIQVAASWQPHEVILLGDMLDLASWSTRFPREPSLRQPSTPSLRARYWPLSRRRPACPPAAIRYVAGNHEDRIRKSQIDKLDETIGLVPVNAPIDSPDVLHLSRLLCLDSLGIEWLGEYDSDHWMFDCIRVNHGRTAKGASGATVAARIAKNNWSEVFGHIHRVELASKRVVDPKRGHRDVVAMTPGCLARCDGTVPGFSKIQNWTQGLGFGIYDENTKTPHLWVEPIHNGRMQHAGKMLVGEPHTEEIAEATGFEQMIKR